MINIINIIIVDDHPIVVNGIKELIETQSDMKVAGVALCGNDCKKLLQQTTPDIILLDIGLPDIDGLDLCKQITEEYSTIKIIALTGFKEYYHAQKMIANGAVGYILKNAASDEIIEGIHKVYSGEKYLCDEIESVISKRQRGNDKLFLTMRETELLKLVVEGFTNKEIANKLFLGVETINSYRKNLLLKLGAKNTAEMVKIALTEHLV